MINALRMALAGDNWPPLAVMEPVLSACLTRICIDSVLLYYLEAIFSNRPTIGDPSSIRVPVTRPLTANVSPLLLADVMHALPQDGMIDFAGLLPSDDIFK